MCGIWAIFGYSKSVCELCHVAFSKIEHRGPEAWRVESDARVPGATLGFQRLAIVDGLYGMQPMKLHKFPLVSVICNGEIYNCKHLSDDFGFQYETNCDVEAIIHLYKELGIDKAVTHLDSEFAFCLVDIELQKVFIARDPYGVRPLFRLYNDDLGVLAVSSEAKGLVPLKKYFKGKTHIEQFPPGYFEVWSLDIAGKATLERRVQYFKPGDRLDFSTVISEDALSKLKPKEAIARLLEESCRKRLMADRRIGCLLSGGLDSSLIAALLVKVAKAENIPYTIQTFAIGMGDSPDLIAAREVAKYLGTEHHEVLFTEADVRDSIDNVLYTIESYDITTTRASLPMYLLSKYIKEKTNTTVIFSGEGADELAQGYIYFRNAPSPEAAHEESIRLLSDIYLYDGLRADRTTSAWSLELRVPFLDIQFTSYFLAQENTMRQPKDGVEKFLLRSSFEVSKLLPDSILWRHKEAFSDGVASVKKSLFEVIGEIVDERLQNANQDAERYIHCPPKTPEALYYRQMFEKSFEGQDNFTRYFWMPKWVTVSDPSARFIEHYAAT